MCDGKTNVGAIGKSLAEKTKSTVNEDLIWLAIDQLKKDNLIANSSELENRFAGMNRRDVIRRIGLGTMVALPIISGLIAPTTVMAQSACGTTCTCGQNNGGVSAGGICRTTGGGTACPTTPAGCATCRAIAAIPANGVTSAGRCYTR